MIDIKARNVRLRKVHTAERACSLVAHFLATTDKEEELLYELLKAVCSTWNRCLTSREMGQFRRRFMVPEATLYVLLLQLESSEVIRKIPAARSEREYLYYLHDNFAKALYRVVRAYRRKMLPVRRSSERRPHAAFLPAGGRR